MGIKRGGSNLGVHRYRGNGGSKFLVLTLVMVLILAPMVFFIGRGIYSTDSIDENDSSISSKQDVDWRTKLALQHVKSLFSKDVIEVIKANTDDMGPLSLDSFRKSNFSTSWKFGGQENVSDLESDSAEVVETKKQENLNDKQEIILDDDHSQYLKSEAIELSKLVDSAVLGKYSIWRKEADNENVDTTIRLMRDQIIMAMVYLSIANMKNKSDMVHELQDHIKESQRALGDATTDNDLSRSAPERKYKISKEKI
nr:polygalacturonate 4-alpha-galacturonosyltransferase-like [Tanacetum cinerariifolium]